MIRPTQEYRDVIEAVVRLGLARLRILATPARCLETRAVSGRLVDQRDPRLIGRVGTAIVRAAARVPWRSDCLVQALAAQSWLAAHGVSSRLHVGVAPAATISPHAWLTCQGEVVVGGDISNQVELYANSAQGRR